MRRKKRLGNGASISCFAKFIHPSQPWRDKLVNNYTTACIQGLNVFGRQEMVVKRHKRVCVLIMHEDFPGQPFQVALGNITVESEGPKDDFFMHPILQTMTLNAVVVQKNLLPSMRCNGGLL